MKKFKLKRCVEYFVWNSVRVSIKNVNNNSINHSTKDSTEALVHNLIWRPEWNSFRLLMMSDLPKKSEKRNDEKV